MKFRQLDVKLVRIGRINYFWVIHKVNIISLMRRYIPKAFWDKDLGLVMLFADIYCRTIFLGLLKNCAFVENFYSRNFYLLSEKTQV